MKTRENKNKSRTTTKTRNKYKEKAKKSQTKKIDRPCFHSLYSYCKSKSSELFPCWSTWDFCSQCAHRRHLRYHLTDVRPSQTLHLTKSSARIIHQKRQFGIPNPPWRKFQSNGTRKMTLSIVVLAHPPRGIQVACARFKQQGNDPYPQPSELILSRAWLSLITLTLRGLGRHHIVSAPCECIAVLCFD